MGSKAKSLLLPKEHGAYAALLLPLSSALVHTRAAPAVLCLGAATILGFWAHEPLLLLWGVRGRRKLEQRATAARRLVAVLGVAALGLAALGVWLRPAALPLLALPGGLALLALFEARRGDEKTWLGELCGMGGLSTACAPLLVAGGVPRAQALAHAAVWVATVVLGTSVVRTIVGRARRPAVVAAALGAAALGAVVVARGWVGAWFVVALAPSVLAVLVITILRVTPRSLRRVGWGLVGTNLATWVLLLPPLSGC